MRLNPRAGLTVTMHTLHRMATHMHMHMHMHMITHQRQTLRTPMCTALAVAMTTESM